MPIHGSDRRRLTYDSQGRSTTLDGLFDELHKVSAQWKLPTASTPAEEAIEPLTVLMPARNAAKTIEAAALSVMRALPTDAKLLILDDASEDSTGQIVRRLAREDGRVGWVKSEAPLGVAAALNTLIERCDTPLVARMDADDLSLPYRFDRQLKALNSRAVDVVFSPIIMFGPSRFAVRPQPPLPVGSDAAAYELLMTNALMHPTLLGRRSSIVNAGGYRAVPAEDWDLWMRMVLAGERLGRIGVPTVLYRRHAGQVTASQDWKYAHSIDPDTARVHNELCERLLGCGRGSYAAFSGSNANADELAAAGDLLESVWHRARKLSWRDQLSVRFTAVAIRRLMKRRYPLDRADGGT